MKRVIPVLLAAALSLPAPGGAKTVAPEHGAASWCGTRISTPAINYARHRFNQQRQKQLRADRVAVGQPAARQTVKVTKQKNIAVLEDNGTVFPPPNTFDLEPGKGVQFKAGAKGTRAERFVGGVSGERGERIAIGDDASRVIDLLFDFKFYGTVYRRVYLNSDGNLTFERAESASTARSLSRFLEGPPRIAVNFLDLDPSVTSGDAGVYLLVRAGLLRITWVRVPQFGASDANTFQLTLYPNGRITMAYDEVSAQEGIVGISPGGPGTINLVDLSRQLPVAPKTDAIAEQFRAVSEIDDMAAAKAILSAVRDEYDLIVLFADFPVDLEGAIAYHAPVKNTIKGIDPFGPYDLSSSYGSDGRLEGFIQMGSLAQYPSGPNELLSFFSKRRGITILGHETGHRWLAFTRFRDATGRIRDDLLGRQLAHWSFLMDSDGSIMEGNDIRDNGDGTFTTLQPYQGFSALDLYLMGFLRPDEVPPFFYVSGSNLDSEAAPDEGVIITGQKQVVELDQIVSAMGPRVPNSFNSQKVIKVAVALLGRQGEPPGPESVSKANRYRNRLSSFFRQQTRDRGRIATFLRLKPTAAAAAHRPVEAGKEAPQAGAAAEDAAQRPPVVEPTRRWDRQPDLERR